MSTASFPYLSVRTCLRAGALFLPALSSMAANALSGRDEGQPAIISGVGRVVDGDTLDVGETRVRLEGIDAPEMAQSCQTASGKTWKCDVAAVAMLRTLVEHKDVACDRTGADRYQRTLATCFADGIDVDEAMVRAGFAWAYVKYSVAYVNAEADARKAKLGVWPGSAEAPWDFRRGEWHVAEGAATDSCAIKGNVSSRGRIYHMPWDPWYDSVNMSPGKGKRWFCSEDEAIRAGWRRASVN